MMRNRTWISAAMVVFAVGALAFAGPGGKGPASLKGQKAPAFELPTLDGQTVNLEALKGNVVVLDFWATWCGPCRAAMPHLQELAANTELASKGLKVFAVNLRETEDKIKPFLEKSQYTFTVPMDKDGAVAEKYMVSGIPTQVVIGRDGNVAAVFVGFDPDKSPKQLDEAIETALKAKGPTAQGPAAKSPQG